MIASNTRIVSLHSARVSEAGDALNVLLVGSDGRLCNVDLPLRELASRAHIIDETHHEAQERALDVAAEAELLAAIREYFAR